MSQPPHLCQIAFSVMDLEGTRGFYRDAFGFLPAGRTDAFRGPLASAVQGLPEAASVCGWLVDQREFMQLEMFQFESPRARARPAGWRPCDIGYTRVGLHVTDLDAALVRLVDRGVRPLGPPLGPGGARRVCIRDPEGVVLELMEDDPRPAGAAPRLRSGVPVAARSVTASVPDLERARRFWVETLQLREVGEEVLHVPEHESLWGLAGARRRTLLLWAGDFLVELVEYDEPRGRPWPDGYRLSDQGLLNVALGFRDKPAFYEVYHRVMDAGYSANSKPVDIDRGAVVYCNDDQGFSVELLCCDPSMDGRIGFAPEVGSQA